MPVNDDRQYLTNIISQKPEIKSGSIAELLGAPFTNAVWLFKKADQWFVDIGDGSGPRQYDGDTYTPQFVVTGITTNENDDDGKNVMIDLPRFKKLNVRLYSGLDRPYNATKVYLKNSFSAGTVGSVILTG